MGRMKWPATYTRYSALGMQLSPGVVLQSPFSFHLGCGYARKKKSLRWFRPSFLWHDLTCPRSFLKTETNLECPWFIEQTGINMFYVSSGFYLVLLWCKKQKEKPLSTLVWTMNTPRHAFFHVHHELFIHLHDNNNMHNLWSKFVAVCTMSASP